jgi:hypothetical protein
MNNVIGANFFRFGELLVGSGGGNDVSAEIFCDLNGGATDTAAGTEDQRGFAGTKLRARDEHVPRGKKDERDGGGVDPIEIFRIRHAVHFGAADVFGTGAVNHVTEIGEIAAEIVVTGKAGGTLAAGYAGSEDDFLADVDGMDFGTDFSDYASGIAARNMRERDGNTGQTATNPEVEMVERASVDADEDFVVTKMRLGDIGVVENSGGPVVIEDDGFHERPREKLITQHNAADMREGARRGRVELLRWSLS